MKVTLNSTDLKTFHGSNANEQTITLGNGNAVGPMEGVLLSAAGCSTIDIVMILERMRQKLESIEVQEQKRFLVYLLIYICIIFLRENLRKRR